MTINVAINGFGRIGRLVCRILCEKRDVSIVAINDLVPADNLAYLFKHDSTHGRFTGDVEAEAHALLINGHRIQVTSEREPEKLPWKQLKVDYVIEATGHFTSEETASKHFEAGAKRVIISAPAKGNIPTFVMGVNEKYIKHNSVRGMAISHQNHLFTLNDQQQTAVLNWLNSAQTTHKTEYQPTALGFDKIVIYRFAGPDIEIIPITSVDHTLIFSVPQWDSQHYLREISSGAMTRLLSTTYE